MFLSRESVPSVTLPSIFMRCTTPGEILYEIKQRTPPLGINQKAMDHITNIFNKASRYELAILANEDPEHFFSTVTSFWDMHTTMTFMTEFVNPYCRHKYELTLLQGKLEEYAEEAKTMQALVEASIQSDAEVIEECERLGMLAAEQEHTLWERELEINRLKAKLYDNLEGGK